MEVTPLIPLKLAYVGNIIFNSKSQDQWCSPVYLEDIYGGEVVNPGVSLITIAPNPHGAVSAAYVFADGVRRIISRPIGEVIMGPFLKTVRVHVALNLL